MDPHISLVFETIGHIKNSLQCSICLDLLNDPQSTKCNHQFCSQCITKVVEERRNKQKEALCPLCKNPVTKRSLTANPRLKEIVDVVQRLNSTFKKDTGLPDSPYPAVNLRNVKESNKSYLQFVAANPTPQKPPKENSLVSDAGNGNQHIHNSPLALKDQNKDAPKECKTPEQDRCSLLSPSLQLPCRENQLETNATNTSTPIKDGDSVEKSESTPTNNDRKPDDGNIHCSQSNFMLKFPREKPPHFESPSDSSTSEAAKCSTVSSSTCRSVSILESLAFNETEEKPIARGSTLDANNEHDICSVQQKTNSLTLREDINGESEEYPYIENNSDDALYCVKRDKIKRNSLILKTRNSVKRTSPSIFQHMNTTNTMKTSTIKTNLDSISPLSNKPECVDNFVGQESSCEFVPGSIESNSSVCTSGGICIPRLDKFLVSEDTALSDSDNEVFDCSDDNGTEILNDRNKSTQLPHSTTKEGRCKPAKRKHHGDDLNTGKKCRRLNITEGRFSGVISANGTVENRRDRYNLELNEATEEIHFDSQYNLSGKVFSLTSDFERLDDEVNRNLTVELGQTGRCVEAIGNDVDTSTPPVHVEPHVLSTTMINNNISSDGPKMHPKHHEGTNGSPAVKITSACGIDVDKKERNVVECNPTNSPVETFLATQEDFLEPCDQDNIRLLRTLGSLSNKESENETDEDVSDSRTADTTSVSSLNEGDCADADLEISSQRIQYLHQVLADTGGEIEKLTADLKTLRDSESSMQLNDEPVDELASENDADDDEKRSCSSVSPPPSPEPSTITLTKLPLAIREMQMMLHNDVDNEKEVMSTVSQHHLSSAKNARKTNYHLSRTLSSHLPTHTLHLRCTNDLKNVSDVPRVRHEKENVSSPVKHTPNNKDFASTHNKEPQSKKVLTEHRVNPNSTSTKNRAVSNPISLVVTRLPKKFVSVAGYLAKRYGGNLTGDLTTETTHVVMPTDSQMFTSRKNYTIKYLLGISLGKWIVSQLWLTACMKSGRLVNEIPFEVKGDPDAAQTHVPNLARTARESQGPGLFDGVSVVCLGDFNGAISKVHITQLVRFCGGQIINSKTEAVDTKISDLVVISDPLASKGTELVIKDICKTFNTFAVSAEWVTDSVANYQLQDIEEYRLES